LPKEQDPVPTPVLIDSNLFIALDAKFGQLEAQNYAQEIIKEARKSGFDPKILRCVLDEVKKHYMRSAIMKVCDPVSIADDDGLKVASMTTCKLTKGDNLTDYKLIAAGMSLEQRRPLLVSSDYLLRREFALLVENCDVQEPFQFTTILHKLTRNHLLKLISRRLFDHFMENGQPEELKRSQVKIAEEIEKEAESQRPKTDRAQLAARYLKGERLTTSERKSLATRGILKMVRELQGSEEPLDDVEKIKIALCSVDKEACYDELVPAFHTIAQILLEREREAFSDGDLALAARFLEQACTFLALSAKQLSHNYVMLCGRRALYLLVLGRTRESLKLLEAVRSLSDRDARESSMVSALLGLIHLLKGDTARAEDMLSRLPDGAGTSRVLKDFAHLLYSQKRYAEALKVYLYLASKDWLEEDWIEPMFRSAGIVGAEIPEAIKSKVSERFTVGLEDRTNQPMPYLTKNYGKEWTILEDPQTPRYLLEPMKICSVNRLPKRTLLVCWNDSMASRIGVNIPASIQLPRLVQTVRLNSGPVKVKTTMLKAVYNIRGEVDVTDETQIEIM